MNSEAATIISTVTAFLVAAFGLAAAFGLDISEDQKNAVLLVVSPVVLVVFLIGPLIRQFVWSRDTVVEEVKAAYDKGVNNEAAPKLAQ